MFGLSRKAKRGLELRAELDAAKLSRRELSKLGLVAGGAAFASGASLREAMAVVLPVLPLTPWKDPMPLPPKLQATGFDYDHHDHQWADRYDADRSRCYDLKLQQHQHKFHSELGASEVWSFNGTFGGPLLDVRWGNAFCLRFKNELDPNHRGYGDPRTTSHLHNMHTATESDGGPWNWLQPGETRIQHYCMARAGFSHAPSTYADPLAPGGTWWAPDGGGDLRETLSTLFLHDHMPDFTAPNLYKGLFMMVRAFDQQDTGDETTGWRLPSGDYDVPLLFQDKQLTPDGEMVFNQFVTDGFLGQYQTVNGAYKPYFEVEPRAYRFRLLNGGPSRFYRLVFRKEGQNVPFAILALSGNLLPKPKKNQTNTDIWVAERTDIWMDFSAYPDGTEIIMSNTLQMRDDGRGEKTGKTRNPDDPANQLVKFIVRRKQASYPKLKLPRAFRPLPPLPDPANLPVKVFEFGRKNGMWAINDRFWDPDIDHDLAAQNLALNTVERDTAEHWILDSRSGGWDHPLHIHFEEGQVFRRNGALVPAGQRYRTDIYRLRDNVVELILRFRDYPMDGFSPAAAHTPETKDDHGRYVMHCHNVVHEDNAMMTTFSIRPPAGA